MSKCTNKGNICTIFLLLLLSWGCDSGNKEANRPPPGDYGRIEQGMVASFADSLAALPVDSRETTVSHFLSLHPVTPVIESDSIFSLYWFGKATRVLVNGDLQSGWTSADTMNAVNCGENRFFHISYKVPPDARLDYQLRVDSIDMTDPRNPVVTPSGYGPHSQVAMPGFIPNPIRHPKSLKNKGKSQWVPFANPGGKFASRLLRIYLPAGYENLKDVPSLYVTDGIEAAGFMDYPTVLDTMITARKIPPLIVIFIPPVDRTSENIGSKTHDFIDGLCDELVPYIDRTFPTSPDPADRAITGISSGGHLALMTMLNRPDVFLLAAGQSPTLSTAVFEALEKFPETMKRSSDHQKSNQMQAPGSPTPETGKQGKAGREDPGIYIDVGRFDLINGGIAGETFLQSGIRFHEKLNKAGIRNRFLIVNDGHEWASWRERLDQLLEFLFGMRR